jgi:hypothetical protein
MKPEINFDNDTEAGAFVNKSQRCETLYEELQKKLGEKQKTELVAFYDAMTEFANFQSVLFYRSGMKKAAGILIDGLVEII